jgi:hypothetical protein
VEDGQALHIVGFLCLHFKSKETPGSLDLAIDCLPALLLERLDANRLLSPNGRHSGQADKQ